MADRRDGPRRPPRAALRSRSRRRWAVFAGIAGAWLVFLLVTGSVTVASGLLLVSAAVAGLCLVALRCLGIDRHHPWVERMAARPWRDGRDVLQLALRHLPEVFIVTPSGSLLAPNAIELHMNPDDFAALTELMDTAIIDSCACEAYQSCIAECGARPGGTGPVEVRTVADPGVPAGRYRLKQGRPVSAGHASAGERPVSAAGSVPGEPAVSAGQPSAGNAPVSVLPVSPGGRPVNGVHAPAGGFAFQASDGRTRTQTGAARAVLTDQLTVSAEPQVPLLRLMTAGSTTATRVSGARAGRGSAVELMLPQDPAISRVHARFTYREGQWWVTGLGRNGLLLNEVLVHGEQVVRDGDSIRWGRQPGALASRVQIGR